MKRNLLFGSCLLLTSMFTQAAPIIIVGTPGNTMLSHPSKPIPNLDSTFINFDSLTTSTSCQLDFVGCPAFTPSTFASEGVLSISSPDGLLVAPFSTQSGPNELFDNGSEGTANITIALGGGSTAIGIGVADFDGQVQPSLTITIQALNSTGGNLGPAFVENLANTENPINIGNAYYVVQDTTPDIYGLRITQSVGSAEFSGLGIDDLQVMPEPSTFLLLATGVALLGAARLRKRAA